MLQEIATELNEEVIEKIDSLYNKRKQKEGLVSVRNSMLSNLKHYVNEWYEHQIKLADKIENIQIKQTEGVLNGIRIN